MLGLFKSHWQAILIGLLTVALLGAGALLKSAWQDTGALAAELENERARFATREAELTALANTWHKNYQTLYELSNFGNALQEQLTAWRAQQAQQRQFIDRRLSDVIRSNQTIADTMAVRLPEPVVGILCDKPNYFSTAARTRLCTDADTGEPAARLPPAHGARDELY